MGNSEKNSFLLKKPAGPSLLGNYGGKYWNNQNWGTDGPVICGACGTKHKENKETGYIISSFLDLDIVEICCGALIDRVYRESGQELTIRFLEEFAENPTDPLYYILLSHIKDLMQNAFLKIKEVSKDISIIKNTVSV